MSRCSKRFRGARECVEGAPVSGVRSGLRAAESASRRPNQPLVREGCPSTGRALIIAAKLDLRCILSSCARFMRLILAILIALSLATSPGPAFSAPSAGCSMPGAESGMAPDHEEMGCCTAECAVQCPSAVLLGGDVGDAPFAFVAPPLEMRPTGALSSVNPSGLDPPPRA